MKWQFFTAVETQPPCFLAVTLQTKYVTEEMKERKTEIRMDLFSQSHMRINLGNNLRSFKIGFGIDTNGF